MAIRRAGRQDEPLRRPTGASRRARPSSPSHIPDETEAGGSASPAGTAPLRPRGKVPGTHPATDPGVMREAHQGPTGRGSPPSSSRSRAPVELGRQRPGTAGEAAARRSAASRSVLPPVAGRGRSCEAKKLPSSSLSISWRRSVISSARGPASLGGMGAHHTEPAAGRNVAGATRSPWRDCERSPLRPMSGGSPSDPPGLGRWGRKLPRESRP